MKKPNEKKPWMVVKNFPTVSKTYKKGKIEFLDRMVARAMKARGVIRPPTDEELKRAGLLAADEGEKKAPEKKPQSKPGPEKTQEGEGPAEEKAKGVDAPGWLERAKEALASENGNKIRSVLSEVDDSTSKLKSENQNRLAKLVALKEG